MYNHGKKEELKRRKYNGQYSKRHKTYRRRGEGSPVR